MKNIILIACFSFATLALFSCKKSGQTPATPPVITARWNLASDSTYNTVFSSWDGMYVGKANDYYDFEPNGKLSWHENGAGTDSAVYTISSDNKMLTIYYFPNKPANSCDCVVPYNISVITDHKMILLSSPKYTPTQGVFYEIMTLSR
jgi:hypothetical protein